MGIDCGGSKVFMSEQALDGVDFVVVFEEMGGKVMTKGMGVTCFSIWAGWTARLIAFLIALEEM
jgi:hypothetical protein